LRAAQRGSQQKIWFHKSAKRCINVAVRIEIVAQDGTEQGKFRNLPTLTKISNLFLGNINILSFHNPTSLSFSLIIFALPLLHIHKHLTTLKSEFTAFDIMDESRQKL
jgi:hypothetical protein